MDVTRQPEVLIILIVYVSMGPVTEETLKLLALSLSA